MCSAGPSAWPIRTRHFRAERPRVSDANSNLAVLRLENEARTALSLSRSWEGYRKGSTNALSSGWARGVKHLYLTVQRPSQISSVCKKVVTPPNNTCPHRYPVGYSASPSLDDTQMRNWRHFSCFKVFMVNGGVCKISAGFLKLNMKLVRRHLHAAKNR